MPTIKKLMLNGIAYKWGETPTPDDALLLESGKEILLENGNYLAKERLLSYEEIASMELIEAKVELNRFPVGYYDKFLSEGKTTAGNPPQYNLIGVYVAFNTNTKRRETPNIQIDFLLVGGGGGGGNTLSKASGGGGGGGVMRGLLQIKTDTTDSIIIGHGGGPGEDGGDSKMNNVTAKGGTAGESGGTSTPGKGGTSGSGMLGGNGYLQPNGQSTGGGGGGHGSSGGTAYDYEGGGGRGGSGREFTFPRGEVRRFGGGGGGGWCNPETMRGHGKDGGGDGGDLYGSNGGDATFYGGGGGGVTYGSQQYTRGGKGYQGVCVFYYKTNLYPGVNIQITGGTITTSGEYTIHTFTSNGTLSVQLA